MKDQVEADGSYPVFVTRYSLSPKTAIGIQTKHYLEEFADWRHLHWKEFGSGLGQSKRSVLLGGFLAARWADHAETMRRVPGLGWLARSCWTGAVLDERTRRELVAGFREKTSALYFAPVDSADAGRMRTLAELFGRPFVLHLWDAMSAPLLQSEDHCWLLENASAVFAVSKPLLREARELRPDASELLFVRETTTHRAQPPDAGPLRVAMIGFLPAYRTGLRLLEEALRELRAKGIAVEVHFVGSRRALGRVKEGMTRQMRPTGHLPSNEARDAALARCHVAFLPGPLESPEVDLRSRYSIPSRVLDFMAVGLPVVGTVHPESATAEFYKGVGMCSHLFCPTAEEVVARLTALREREAWERAQQMSLAAFARIDCAGQKRRLKAAMAAAASLK